MMILKMTTLILKITFLKMTFLKMTLLKRTFLKMTFLSRSGHTCASIAAPGIPSRRAAAANMDHHRQTPNKVEANRCDLAQPNEVGQQWLAWSAIGRAEEQRRP